MTNIAFFATDKNQKNCIHHSDWAFNALQIEISVEPVSIAKGWRFTHQSCSYSFKVYSKLTMTLTFISVGKERATNTGCLTNTFERN